MAAAQVGNVLAQHGHLALGGQFFAEDQLQQGGFARAGVTQQKDELAVVDMEVDILQRQRPGFAVFL